jgi:hypothetical protein
MLNLVNLDLSTDSQARRYLKNEVVQVQFASHSGELMSLEGPNRYAPGDALITGSTGDVWCVSRDRFEQKYLAQAPLQQGQAGAYRNLPKPVLAKQVDHEFTLARSAGGDILSGSAGDWVVQYAPGDYGVVANPRFQTVYRPTED